MFGIREGTMSTEQPSQELTEAFERIIATAQDVERRGLTRWGDEWGPG
jgi:hypothetical protein